MATKKMNVPDIGNLLGEITKKRDSGELPKTEKQYIKSETMEESNVVQTALSKNGKTGKQENSEPRGAGGRPSMKSGDIEYTKISPRIPKALKKRVEFALVEERFSRAADGRHIKTLDEIVELALERILSTP